MKAISGKHLARALERKGWVLARVHGSHHVYKKPDSSVRISVPIHGSKALKTGLAKHLLKIAGLTDADFD
jgi:predicted RNA binding protein YcfA (HicA-like mRNA interferase family)